ncbi:MAG: hypothetical protein GY789_24080 [Hyphomicrobiales bacterium]|nr:hypothetical protein [Hyphomicrobiales bacterium]MCP5000623.1 hypothetical protein [Hyphomicrobiales bacterium]
MLLLLLYFVAASVVGGIFFVSVTDTAFSTTVPESVLLLFVTTVAGIVIALVCGAAVAIGWHRYVLREEIPDRFYVLRREWPVMKYIWRGVMIGCLSAIIAWSLILLALSLLSPDFTELADPSTLQLGDFAPSLIAMLAIGILMTWAVLHIGLILPATAVGQSMSMAESFRLARAFSGQLLITAILLVLFGSIPSVIDQLLIDETSSSYTAFITIPVSLVFS